MLNVNNENSGCSFYSTQNITECNITGTAKIWLFYQTYSGGLGFIHLIFTQNTENHAINLFWQKGEFQDVDLWPAELRSAPDSIELCNRQLGDDYMNYMSPNTNVTHIVINKGEINTGESNENENVHKFNESVISKNCCFKVIFVPFWVICNYRMWKNW
jgi:hypothetical protein